MSYLEFDHVGKVYRSGVRALSNIKLAVQTGEFVVLVGPSGCGKSTLLRIVAGLENATEGSLLLDGVEINNMAPKDRDVAMVFQNYALYPHLTVRENLEFALRMRGVKRTARNAQVESTAEMLQITTLLNRTPPQLSGGQQQRVALGRAIVRQPKVFLLDEPFSNLDAALRASTRVEILKLHRKLNATTVFVTHDQVEALSMADKLVVLRDGVIQQIGSPAEVYRRPANQFVARFIGSPPMNLLPAQALNGAGAITIDGQRFSCPVARNLHGQVLLGLRAEHVSVANGHTPPGQVSFPATAVMVENLGNEKLATFATGSTELVVRLDTQVPVQVGESIRLVPELENAIFFDTASGAALQSAVDK